MSKITDIKGLEVLDSRGNPTVYARVQTDKGVMGEAMVPSGASTGKHEAVEKRDGQSERYNGLGVRTAVSNIEGPIKDALVGFDTGNQSKVDRRLMEADGSANKSNLGANALLAVSMACARAEAAAQGVELYTYLQQLGDFKQVGLPVPQMNLINGGRHASNSLAIQEYHVLPVGAPSFAEALRMGVEIYMALRKILIAKNFQVEVADEGGFAPRLEKSEHAFELLIEAIEAAGYVPGSDAFLGIDAAASEFYDETQNTYEMDGRQLSAIDLGYQFRTWREQYPIISVEDPFAEDDWVAWQAYMEQNGGFLQVVGDDLYATNVTRLQEGIRLKATNAILVKLNQAGTLSETLEVVSQAREAGQNTIISHRSGETEDAFIADLSVAVGAGQIKTGAPSRSDRTAKYNRLLYISSQLEDRLTHSLQPFLEKYSGR